MSNIKTNYITKTGFYLIDDNSPSVIDIEENVYASILIKNIKKVLTINLSKNSHLDFYGFFNEVCPIKIFFNQLYEGSIINAKIMFINKNNNLTSNIKSYISSNDCKSFLSISGIIVDNKLSIDSKIEIEKDIKNIECRLDKENIFTSEKGSVVSVPGLLVSSNDIIASHSSKTYKLDENKLFYLKSRGLSHNDSVKMILESYFHNNFRCLEMIDKNEYNLLQKDFINIINNNGTI